MRSDLAPPPLTDKNTLRFVCVAQLHADMVKHSVMQQKTAWWLLCGGPVAGTEDSKTGGSGGVANGEDGDGTRGRLNHVTNNTPLKEKVPASRNIHVDIPYLDSQALGAACVNICKGHLDRATRHLRYQTAGSWSNWAGEG